MEKHDWKRECELMVLNLENMYKTCSDSSESQRRKDRVAPFFRVYKDTSHIR